MIVKLFEIRDKGTFIPVMAVLMWSDLKEENYLLDRSGYSANNLLVTVTMLAGGSGQSSCDQFDWRSRTMRFAHDHIQNNFTKLSSGDVIDIKYILGETNTKKLSERITHS